MAWVSVLDDTYWVTSNSANPPQNWIWNGSVWNFGDGIEYIPDTLQVKGDWTVGYEPTEMRISITIAGQDPQNPANDPPSILIGNSSFLGNSVTSYTGGGTDFVLNINLSTPLGVELYFAYIEFDNIKYITITNIEFSPAGPATGPEPNFWTNYVGTREYAAV